MSHTTNAQLSISEIRNIIQLSYDMATDYTALALAKEVTALTEAFVIPAGSITPPVVMLFDKPLVILPII